MRALAHGAGRGRRGGGMLRRFDWLAVLVVGMVLFELVRRTLIETQNPNFVPSLILLGVAVIPASFLTFVAGRRLPADIPGIPVAVTALLGGVIGTVVAGALEYDTLLRLDAVPMLAVIEEAAKLVVPAALLFSFYSRSRPTGSSSGVASSAGSAVLETMGYAVVALVESRSQLAAVDSTLLLRGLFSPAAHMAWTGLTAAALWHTVARRCSSRAVGTLVGTYVLAVVLHTLWDSLDKPHRLRCSRCHRTGPAWCDHPPPCPRRAGGSSMGAAQLLLLTTGSGWSYPSATLRRGHVIVDSGPAVVARALDQEVSVRSTDDRRRILGILLAFATATQTGDGQRGLGVWSQLDGCAWHGITR